MNIKLDIPESFYQGEERCGYYVSPEMKKVWAVQLDLLNEFDRICKKHDIKYYAAYGTLIGAVRHKGYIPWDDDMDIIIMREDYDRFCRVAPAELEYPYFFHSVKNAPAGDFPVVARLLNQTTTMFNYWSFDTIKRCVESGYPFDFMRRPNIYIDIFPAYDVPDDETAFRKLEKKLKLLCKIDLKLISCTDYYRPAREIYKRPVKAALHYLLKKLKITARYYFNEFISTMEASRYDNCSRVATLGNSWGNYSMKDHTFSKKDFDVIYSPFEMLTIPVPSGYKNILDSIYGDWNTYKIRLPHGTLYDTEHPYTYYTDEGHIFELNSKG